MDTKVKMIFSDEGKVERELDGEAVVYCVYTPSADGKGGGFNVGVYGGFSLSRLLQMKMRITEAIAQLIDGAIEETDPDPDDHDFGKCD